MMYFLVCNKVFCLAYQVMYFVKVLVLETRDFFFETEVTKHVTLLAIPHWNRYFSVAFINSESCFVCLFKQL